MSEIKITKRKEKCENCTKQCNKKPSSDAPNSLQDETMNGEVSVPAAVPPVLLSACLSCDGCVSEEERLKISQQSLQEIDHVLALNKGCAGVQKVLVFSVCPQSLPLFAVRFRLDVQTAAQKLCAFLKGIGVRYVFDTTIAASFSVLESRREFVRRYRRHDDAPATPMFTSSCPGWIRYAEHMLGGLVTSHICTARSPQQIMGSLVKDYFSRQQNLDPEQVYHVVVAPCFDKKLEAVREEYYNSLLETRDVDCVLTSVEILHMMDQRRVLPESLAPVPLDHVFGEIGDASLSRHEGRGSEGFLEHIFKYAAKDLFGLDVQEITYKTHRNRDFQEVMLERDGETLLHFAAVYGFRNIQTLVHRMRKGKVPYHLVEVLSCPGGCLSGRGQAEGEEGRPDRALVLQMEDAYSSLPVCLPDARPEVQRLFEDWLHGEDSPHARQRLHTRYTHDTHDTGHPPLPDMQW